MSASSIAREWAVQISEPAIDIWVFVIAALGSCVALIDGLTRPLNIDAEETAIDPLTYEPYKAAFIFALILIPFVIAYARKHRVGFPEGLLLWFVLCTSAYTKDFAYMAIPGTRIYVTDAVLMVLLISLFVWPRLRWLQIRKMPMLGLALFFLSGAIAIIRGLVSAGAPLLVIRDSAIVVYALFLPVGLFVIRSWEAVKRIFLFFVLGTLCTSITALAWFVMEPGQRRYALYGIYMVVAFIGIATAMLNKKIKLVPGWLVLTVLASGILLYNARAAYLAMACALGTIFILGVEMDGRHRLATRLKLLAAFIAICSVSFFVVLQTKKGEQFIVRSTTELIDGLLHSSDDPTSQFRLLAWAEAIRRFVANPVCGEGFGIPFTFDIYDTDPRPHNSYLTVLYKMGIVGFIPFMAVVIYFFRVTYQALHRYKTNPQVVILYSVFLAELVMAVNGAFNHIVESPFNASIFWGCAGLGIRCVRLLQQNSSDFYAAEANRS